MRDDAQLLRAYAEGGDEAAFAELVNRYINLVWGAGYRVTGDADLARDVAQAAFTELTAAFGRLMHALEQRYPHQEPASIEMQHEGKTIRVDPAQVDHYRALGANS